MPYPSGRLRPQGTRRATDNCCSADSLDKGGGDILVADPDGVTITWYACNAETNIDIIAFELAQATAGIYTDGCVVVAGSAEGGKERTLTHGCVAAAGLAHGGSERIITHGGVAVAGAIASERHRADRRVADASRIASKGAKTGGGVVEASRIASKGAEDRWLCCH